MIWREKRILLSILGVLLAANALFFFTYRVQYQSRLDSLDVRMAETKKQLDDARAARVSAERRYQSYQQIEKDVQEIYNEHWATQRERLTAMIGEVKRLTLASSLVPSSIGFTKTDVEIKSTPTAGRRTATANLGASEVGISFGVAGTYEQVRRLINLLELSRQFVIIRQVGLAAREGNQLTLSLELKTLFRDEKPGVANQRL